MTTRMNAMQLYAAVAALLSALALIEYGGVATNSGALLVTLVWWTALLQGVIALVAISDLVGTRWIRYLRQELLCLQPLLLLPPAMFLLFAFQIHKYPWSAKPPHLWLTVDFFIVRNLVALLICYGISWVFTRKSLTGAANKGTWAVLYLFSFVVCQHLVAIDWVMSLEWPWFSSLFGPFFAVEALYMAFIFAAFIFCLSLPQKRGIDPVDAPLRLGDLGRLTYGFSVMWGGFLYAQAMLIWYGNLPEEVGYVLTRLQPPFTPMAYAFVALVFVLPFLLLTPGPNKRRPAILMTVAILITLGLFTEKTLYVAPVIPFDRGMLLLENSLIAALVMMVIHSRELLLPQPD